MRPAQPDDFRPPDLRFVPVESLVPHERHDDQRLGALVEKFREEAVLRNPPVVAPIADSADGSPRYMVLDGANRATAGQAAGLLHMVVQVTPYGEPSVQLSTWHHGLSAMRAAEFDAACRAIAGLECVPQPLLHAQAQLARREVLAYALHAGGEVITFGGGDTLGRRSELLNAIVDTYRERQPFYRMSTESFEVARERHPDVTGLVIFPHFAPAEVQELAENGARLPAGITRHVIRWRALRVNVPMERMTDRTQSLEEKNRWLAGWLKQRFNDRQVRFYEEPTVLFDE
ncbi:MAG: hypothetical protein A2W00_09335 [Candidatus Eisenbacteria bacterium RBG_16_71_46]|nr:MAG: hypothetical protein A2W00_09335 [Candidatus Eisenbacteria bacterium RBG_16_71_46]OGF21786.1 MAG: hypothetical protein A2V63_06525 [Candidatus Eisenbacteria bacterium RBG_19FT_COMBO_70_11]